MQSISTINRNMSVTESVLGRSVRPMRRKARKDRGHRILCLDGGGVKVRERDKHMHIIGGARADTFRS